MQPYKDCLAQVKILRPESSANSYNTSTTSDFAPEASQKLSKNISELPKTKAVVLIY